MEAKSKQIEHLAGSGKKLIDIFGGGSFNALINMGCFGAFFRKVRPLRRAMVRSNLIGQEDSTTDGCHTGITIREPEKFLADNNLVDVGYLHPVSYKKSVSPSFLNNRDPAGRLIRGYD